MGIYYGCPDCNYQERVHSLNPDSIESSDAVRLIAHLTDTIVTLSKAKEEGIPFAAYRLQNTSDHPLLVSKYRGWDGGLKDGECAGLRVAVGLQGTTTSGCDLLVRRFVDQTGFELLNAGDSTYEEAISIFNLCNSEVEPGRYYVLLQICSYEWIDSTYPVWIGTACSDTMWLEVIEQALSSIDSATD